MDYYVLSGPRDGVSLSLPAELSKEGLVFSLSLLLCFLVCCLLETLHRWEAEVHMSVLILGTHLFKFFFNILKLNSRNPFIFFKKIFWLKNNA